jgi:hypothetical protein
VVIRSGSIELQRCWCGTRNPYFAPLYQRCGGYGHTECLCGGDFCVCHNHGDVECFGCEDCERDDDDDEGYPSYQT